MGYQFFTRIGENGGKSFQLKETAMQISSAENPGPAMPSARAQALRLAAQELEASFLAEMLKHAGLGTAPGGFGGGAGEEQFASFLRLEQARAIAQVGGIGLAEQLFRILVSRDNGAV